MKLSQVIILMVITRISLINAACVDTAGGNCLTTNGVCENDICWCVANKGGTDCIQECTGDDACTPETDVCTALNTCTACSTITCVNGDCGSTGYPTPGIGCRCDAGWTDADCNTDIDDCSPNPCLNGGVCTDKVNDYSCVCADGYTGTDCADVDCSGTSPCKNEGTCDASTTPDECTCATGFTGLICDEVDCTGDPCVEGTCDAAPDPDVCTCDTGYAGLICDKVKCDESDNQCENEGTCGTDGLCDCADGFTGDLCAEGGASRITTALPLMLIALFLFKLFN